MSRHTLPQLKDVKDLAGKKVFLRASLDVPVEEGEVRDQFRIMRVLATVNYLVDKKAKVILAGHIGRDPELSLEPVAKAMNKYVPISFVSDIIGDSAKKAIEAMKNGEVIMLENLRQNPREKANDPSFAKNLADLAAIYVNSAFSVAHRAHASMVGVPSLLPAYAGLNFVHEYEELSKALKPKSPSLFLLGGAKFDTKMPLVEKFLKLYDHVFVGGALANDFFKAKGFEVGQSLVSVDLIGNPILENKKILLPVDVTVMSDNGVRVTTPDDVKPEEKILDAGPKTIEMLAPLINEAKMVLWNGPFGDYEHGFNVHTEKCARLIADAKGYSVIGGGDTVAAIESLNLQEKFNFLSTAGGAMLTFLEQGSLPGIDALLKK